MEDNGAKIFTDKKNQLDYTASIYTSVHNQLKVEAISLNEAEFSKLFNKESFCDKQFSGKAGCFHDLCSAIGYTANIFSR